VPAAVRRQVYERDGGGCAYVSPDGRRCGSRWFIEVHHRRPWARGGAHTVDDLELRCRTHDLQAARADFGGDHVASKARQAQLFGGSTG